MTAPESDAANEATETSANASASVEAEAPVKGEATASATVIDAEASPLKVHHLRPAPGARTKKTRVGRGEGSKGKTAGRGTKGSRARGGVPARFEGGQMPLHMRLPKLKGFTNPNRVEYQVVNTGRLAELFPNGGEVGPEELAARGAVRPDLPVKVLGTGDLAVALQVKAHKFSSSAKDKIAAAGGSATTI